MCGCGVALVPRALIALSAVVLATFMFAMCCFAEDEYSGSISFNSSQKNVCDNLTEFDRAIDDFGGKPSDNHATAVLIYQHMRQVMPSDLFYDNLNGKPQRLFYCKAGEASEYLSYLITLFKAKLGDYKNNDVDLKTATEELDAYMVDAKTAVKIIQGGGNYQYNSEFNETMVSAEISKSEANAAKVYSDTKKCTSVYKEPLSKNLKSKPIYEMFQCGDCSQMTFENRENTKLKDIKNFETAAKKKPGNEFMSYVYLNGVGACTLKGFVNPTVKFKPLKKYEKSIPPPPKDTSTTK